MAAAQRCGCRGAKLLWQHRSLCCSQRRSRTVLCNTALQCSLQCFPPACCHTRMLPYTCVKRPGVSSPPHASTPCRWALCREKSASTLARQRSTCWSTSELGVLLLSGVLPNFEEGSGQFAADDSAAAHATGALVSCLSSNTCCCSIQHPPTYPTANLPSFPSSAGIADPHMPDTPEAAVAHWRRVIDTNLTGEALGGGAVWQLSSGRLCCFH